MMSSQYLYGPGDIEGHIGLDNNMYVVDFGRLMPPEAPSYNPSKNKRAIFYHLLPATLVKDSPEPLCSDAFTKWNSTENLEERQEIENRVERATRRLYEEFIPAAAAKLDAEMLTDWSKEFADNVLWTNKTTLEELNWVLSLTSPREIHKFKFNIRHLGRLRSHVKSPHAKKVILSACAARVAKDDLKELFKLKTFEVSAPSHHPYKKVIVKFLNQLHGHTKASKSYWNALVSKRLQEKFEGCLTNEERTNFDLYSHIDLRLVYLLLLKTTGIVLTHEAESELVKSPEFRFVEADIIRMEPVIKFQSQVYLWGSLNTLASVDRLIKRGVAKPAEILRSLKAAEARLEEAYSVSPTCPLINMCYAITLVRLAEVRGFVGCDIDRIDEFLDTCAKVIGQKCYIKALRAEVLLCYAKCLEKQDNPEANEFRAKSLATAKEAADEETSCRMKK